MWCDISISKRYIDLSALQLLQSGILSLQPSERVPTLTDTFRHHLNTHYFRQAF